MRSPLLLRHKPCSVATRVAMENTLSTQTLHQRHSTLLGLGAIALWSSLAALTVLSGTVPPYQLTSMTFAVATVVGLVWARARGQSLAKLRDVPAGAWALGIYGLVGFHVCYFMALRQAPPLEASLVCYLWPLLIVVFSGFIGGSRLSASNVAGAALGFLGTALVMFDAAGRPSFSGSVGGYALAAAAAFIWASYSVGSRRYQQVPSLSVVGACAATAMVTLALHMMFETTVWPQSATQWAALLGLGLGPTGLAFYLWDEGMKHGQVRLLGAASYATPLLSTVLLAALGLGTLSPLIIVGALLVTVGAALAGR
jgi:drug/metabolite transporter (DMT)-like permease